MFNKEIQRLFEKLMAHVLIFSLATSAAYAGIVTNKDILSLLEAGMSEDVIIQAIKQGEPEFDTSSTALIQLKEKGATPAILKLVLAPKKSQETASKAELHNNKVATASNGINPEEIKLLEAGQETGMLYTTASMRTAARALGFGGMASYAILQGSKAQLRLKTSMPEFIVSIPKNAQPGNYVTLASFASRGNNTREVSTGGGYMSYSTGIHKSRVVEISAERMDDQSRAKEGFVLYRIKPNSALKSGEYALVLYTGEVRIAGFFTSAANSYFDFGLD